jgi:tryptophan halogenase
MARLWPVTPEQPFPRRPDAYRTVGIVGGGTAGYLTALALRRLRPELRVTLIESSKIPVIGVGEATTPELVKFLHSPQFLGRDVLDLYRRVQPTWKLGIKFMFGPRDFTFPFQRGRLLESQLYDGHLDRQSLGAMLMASDRAPVFRDEAGRVTSLAHVVRWAYHLENRRFVRYLHEEALAAGVEHVDARIDKVERGPSGDEVAALVTDDGRRLEFDLYVDCSGFRSLLLEETLGSPFEDWSSTLFTDRAVIASLPHDGTVKPYTLAETMDAGWCWNIPFEDEDHRGYVFSSSFLTPEQAEAEMRAKNPAMGPAGLVKFRSGRHRDFWRGNVLAIGNAYGFVEPLESTAIHMVVLTLELLARHFPESRSDRATVRALDRKVRDRWDALRWFLGIHYRYNGRLDTPFWCAARAEANVEGAEARVALFRERAPLSYKSSLHYTVIPPEFFSDDHSFDTLLMGQGVSAHYTEPVEARATWQRRMAVLERLRASALGQAEALEWLRHRPEAVTALATSPESWVHSWIPT